MLFILSIAFNHGQITGTANALNLRRNGATPRKLPEWRAGETVTPDDSAVAYAAETARGKVISLEASFAQRNGIVPTVEIRAIATGPDGTERTLSGTPVLGSLDSKTVSFDQAGLAGPVTFDLLTHGVNEVGVGIHQATWRWEARAAQSMPWQPFALTAHKVYTVLRTPTEPWTQTPFADDNDTLLWTDVLEVACTWAGACKTEDEAVDRIAKAVNSLGGALLRYDCAGSGASHYVPPAMDHFDCAAFLERLSGGFGRGPLVNCVDCATMVSTFANGLGCDLFQSRMGMHPPLFACNPILAIGSTTWETPCGVPGFSFHEVAWSGGCTAQDRVADACLQLDIDEDPTAAPHIPAVPANEVFGNSGDGNYRDRLAAPAGRDACEPQPAMRQRRSVSASNITRVADLPALSTTALREAYAFPDYPGLRATSRFFWRFFFSGFEMPGWTLVSSRADTRMAAPRTAARLLDGSESPVCSLIRTLWAHGSTADAVIHVDTYECASAQSAHDLLLRLLGEFELPMMRRDTAGAGDLSFTAANRGATVFAIGNHVHLARRMHDGDVDVTIPARSLATSLGSAPSHPAPLARNIEQPAAAPVALFRSVPTTLAPTRWYKFFGPGGEFRAEGRSVVFVAPGVGTHQIAVIAVDPFEGSTVSAVRVHAS